MFTYPGGAKKTRKTLEKVDGKHQMFWEPATQAGQVPFLPPDFEPRDRMILAEGETDTMATWQALKDAGLLDKVGVVGLSGTDAWKDRYAEELFGSTSRVFVVFDNEDPYENEDAAESTERGWRKVRQALGRKARRVVLPQGINDLAEYFQTYDWAAFQVLLTSAATPKMNYPRLDLSKDPPPTDWLLDGLIAAPDVTVLYGDGGVSKSMVMHGLSVAMAEGHETFLGLPLRKHGRVLVVDEENPFDVVQQRLKKLGLTPQGMENLYYIWYGHVRLDEEPERLIEDVEEWEPAAVFIDSFSRVQNAGEIDTDAMNTVFNDALYPIARKLGVPVIALHHVNANGRIRGARAIRNAADLTLEVVPYETEEGVVRDTYTMFPEKARRGQRSHITYQVVGYDENDNPTQVLDDETRVELERRDAEEALPF